MSTLVLIGGYNECTEQTFLCCSSYDWLTGNLINLTLVKAIALLTNICQYLLYGNITMASNGRKSAPHRNVFWF